MAASKTLTFAEGGRREVVAERKGQNYHQKKLTKLVSKRRN
jgi:hypothetical protein